jgi:hypothetical protein
MLDAFFGIFIMLLEDKGEEAAAVRVFLLLLGNAFGKLAKGQT